MVALKAWVIGLLVLWLPPDWVQTRAACGPVSSIVVPGGTPVEECSAVWTRGEQEIYAYVWKPFPPRDGGPMVKAEEWPGTFLGQPMRIVRTKTFLGMDQDVLVAAVHIDTPSANVMVYARGLSLEEFRAIIEGGELAPPEEAKAAPAKP
ncbi:MAG: hypothetical protein IT548_01885 [Alphaproteobacteria bacterium]|nr:hypothetical protein [Alphaproteobacteria bacterium]